MVTETITEGKAALRLRENEYILPAGITLMQALEKAGINREMVLATRHGELITDDELIRPGDLIQLVAVISGG